MAERIKPELMADILRQPNWTLANAAARATLDLGLTHKRPPAPPPPSLIVPVDVQALYVPPGTNSGERFVRLPMDLTSGDPDERATADPFSAAVRRPGGVHLHWALPDGLLRGEFQEDADDPLSLRALPNRWLILRMTGRSGVRRLDITGWVVSSEDGKVEPLEGYPNGAVPGNGPRLQPDELTATAGGSPTWTSAYDAAINRFALHDDLSGLDADAVLTGLASYVVIGWWSERSADPLAGAFTPLTTSRILDDLGWSASPAPIVPSYTSPGTLVAKASTASAGSFEKVELASELRMTSSQLALSRSYRPYEFDDLVLVAPRTRLNTVMHGTVQGVPVRGGVSDDTAPKAGAIELAFAPTLETMIASFAAKHQELEDAKSREYLESLLTAVANSSIRDIDSPDGIVALDEAEHGDGFESFQGPETYEDVIIEAGPQALKGGRGQRSRLAASKAGGPVLADVMWQGQSRGTVKFVDAQMKSRVHKSVNDLYRIKDVPPAEPAGEVRRIRRPGPRFHRATPPVLGLRNYGRHPRFNDDGLHTEDGTLACRWASELAVAFGTLLRAEDYLRDITNSHVPTAVNRIVQHSFLLDPYLLEWVIKAIVDTVPPAEVVPAQNRLKGEMALRYSADGIYDGQAPVLRSAGRRASLAEAEANAHLFLHSLAEGVEPSPVSITSWAQPWCPIWLEWELEITPGDGLGGFDLGAVDYEGLPPLSEARPRLMGRAPLTTGLARSYQAAITTYLAAEAQRDDTGDGEIGSDHEEVLAELADFLTNPDMGSVTIDGLEAFWLGLDEGPDGQVRPTPVSIPDALRAAGLPRLLTSGRLRLTRARVIDTFGRVRNLPVDQLLMPAAHEITGPDDPPALRRPPRLAVPARLMWRLTDPASEGPDAPEAALNQQTPALSINPIAGFLLPDFIDEALEVFGADGTPLGQIMEDSVSGGLMWEGGVGRDGPAVTLPGEGLPAAAKPCGDLAQGMIDIDIATRADPDTRDLENPLSAFLRAVDTTSWSVEGNLNLSGASVAGLVGRPVAVVTARLRLDVPQDLAITGAYGEEADEISAHLLAEQVRDRLKSIAFPIRLGEISKAHDGLYGFYVNNDYSRLHLVEPLVGQLARINRYGGGYRALLGRVGAGLGTDFLPEASPLESPYISQAGDLPVHVGQVVRLTLLMHPYARIHATSGILPRKSLELLRDWVAPGLSKIAPSARIGPVLIDPDKVRLPKIAAFGADQTWVKRNTPITWRDDPILSATQAALLPQGRVRVEEGYIRIAPNTDSEEGSS
ncbi:hypothetical protein [Roseobacter sp.]|uniref:hypothetical protein n=1 Tax=Roseobacter sp. TaxID=1907202 RepID=UPI003298F128